MIKDFICKTRLLLIPCKLNRYRPKFLNGDFLIYYGLVLLLLKLIIVPFLFHFPNTTFFADLTKINLIELTNAARENFGFQPLKENSILDQAAYLKAKDMMEKGYFAHYSPEGVTPWYWLETSGYGYTAAGENLAIGFLESEEVHSAWMNSPSHKKNILNPNYQEIGIAVVKGIFKGKETSLVVQFFGDPKPVIRQENISQVPAEKVEEKLPKTTKEESVGIIEKETQEELFAVAEEKKTEVLSKPIVKGEHGEIISAASGEKIEKTPTFLLFQFMTSDYYSLIQKIIYGSLILIILLLLITIFCDIFIYRRFEIQYKDIIFKTFVLSILWFVLLFLDKMTMIGLINPQNFMIY